MEATEYDPGIRWHEGIIINFDRHDNGMTANKQKQSLLVNKNYLQQEREEGGGRPHFYTFSSSSTHPWPRKGERVFHMHR